MIPHWHCPCGCEHPQPFLFQHELYICGLCWFKDNRYVCLMVYCTPKTCPGGE